MLLHNVVAQSQSLAFDEEQPFASEDFAPGSRPPLSGPARVAVLLASDLSALLIAAVIGYLAWAGLELREPVHYYFPALPLLALFPLTYALAGLYPGFGLGAVETIRRLFNSTTAACVLIAAASFVMKADPAYSRVSFAFAWLAALVLVPLLRFITLTMVRDLRWWGEPTIIFGSPAEAALTVRCVREAYSLGYRVVGVVSPDQ